MLPAGNIGGVDEESATAKQKILDYCSFADEFIDDIEDDTTRSHGNTDTSPMAKLQKVVRTTKTRNPHREIIELADCTDGDRIDLLRAFDDVGWKLKSILSGMVYVTATPQTRLSMLSTIPEIVLLTQSPDYVGYLPSLGITRKIRRKALKDISSNNPTDGYQMHLPGTFGGGEWPLAHPLLKYPDASAIIHQTFKGQFGGGFQHVVMYLKAHKNAYMDDFGNEFIRREPSGDSDPLTCVLFFQRGLCSV